ncbi:MAG: RNA polymerase sigma factor [Clostridia bacterium]|nr:RNA polymerase sigma factor [Clostridia bacterium]
MDDGQIIALLEARNEEAISAIEKKYSAYLKRIAMNVLGSEADAEECVNETYFRAWRRIPPEIPRDLAAYLGKIVRDLAIDAYRAKKSRLNTASEYENAFRELGIFDPSGDGTEHTADGIFLRDTIAAFLKKATEKERKVFVRRYFFFDPVKTISEKYRMSESDVKVTLFRTRNKLKKYLEKEGYAP